MFAALEMEKPVRGQRVVEQFTILVSAAVRVDV
jgi:hypothetical protein